MMVKDGCSNHDNNNNNLWKTSLKMHDDENPDGFQTRCITVSSNSSRTRNFEKFSASSAIAAAAELVENEPDGSSR